MRERSLHKIVMNLGEVRKNINEVDDKMKALFEARMVCSNEIAKIKYESGDSIFKPDREKEMYGRFADNPQYVAFLKKVVQLSRYKQYEFFADNEDTSDFREFIQNDLKGGKMTLELKADENSKKGLCIKDILSVVSSSMLDVVCIEANNENNNVLVIFNVPNDELSQKEAYILKYMLKKETL